MPEHGKLKVGDDAPRLPWWKRALRAFWQDTRPTVAVISMIQGPFYVLSGLLIFGAFVFSPPQGKTWSVIASYAMFGLAWAYCGARITRWGYRTVTVRHLNELAVVGVVAAIGTGIIAFYDGAPLRDAVGFAGLFVVLSAALFIVGRVKADKEERGS